MSYFGIFTSCSGRRNRASEYLHFIQVFLLVFEYVITEMQSVLLTMFVVSSMIPAHKTATNIILQVNLVYRKIRREDEQITLMVMEYLTEKTRELHSKCSL